jgi:hypothetical protein
LKTIKLKQHPRKRNVVMANPLKSQTILTSIPPLENGDRLTRPEFERRYNQMPNVKAELIEGVVYMPAALRFKSHAQPHGNLMIWLGFCIRLDLDNEPQPDAVLFINENCGGKVKITEDDYLEGSPELVAEIAASSVSIELGDKKRVYRRNEVQEYLVWQSYENQFNWFVLENGEYIQLQPDDAGIIRSRVFPGLWLAVNELLAGNMKQVLQVLQSGLESVEHQAFLNR